jgi:hypothetical protein
MVETFPDSLNRKNGGGRGFQTRKNVFRIGGNTFYDRKNIIPMKIPEFKRSGIGLNGEFPEFQMDFPTNKLHNIMSESMTIQASPSKHNRRSNYSDFAAVGGSTANGSAVDGGFATTPNAAGNTKKVETISPLSAALVLKVISI